MSIKQRFYLKVGTEHTCFSLQDDYSFGFACTSFTPAKLRDFSELFNTKWNDLRYMLKERFYSSILL